MKTQPQTKNSIHRLFLIILFAVIAIGRLGYSIFSSDPSQEHGTMSEDNGSEYLNLSDEMLQYLGGDHHTCENGEKRLPIGSPCDDGDPNTRSDTVNAFGCGCVGIPDICRSGATPGVPGESCEHSPGKVYGADGCICINKVSHSSFGTQSYEGDLSSLMEHCAADVTCGGRAVNLGHPVAGDSPFEILDSNNQILVSGLHPESSLANNVVTGEWDTQPVCGDDLTVRVYYNCEVEGRCNGDYSDYASCCPFKVAPLDTTAPCGCEETGGEIVDVVPDRDEKLIQEVPVDVPPMCGQPGYLPGPNQCNYENDAMDDDTCTPGYGASCEYCKPDCSIGTITGDVCGDGKINGSETCDNGSLNGRACTAAYGSSCEYCSSTCKKVEVNGAVCGDGKNDTQEQCDVGSSNGKACTPGYGSTCTYCTSNCQKKTVKGPICGDGNKDAGEQCDKGSQNGILCTASAGSECTYCDNSCQNVVVSEACHILNCSAVTNATCPANQRQQIDGVGYDSNNCKISCGESVCVCENTGQAPKTKGSVCNDNNANTENDIILADGCSCEGTQIEVVEECLPYSCPEPTCPQGERLVLGDMGVDANDCETCREFSCEPVLCGEADYQGLDAPGNTCDDNNPNTKNDTYNENCTCEGEPLVCGDDGFDHAAISDACTNDELYDEVTCSCIDTTPPEENKPDGVKQCVSPSCIRPTCESGSKVVYGSAGLDSNGCPTCPSYTCESIICDDPEYDHIEMSETCTDTEVYNEETCTCNPAPIDCIPSKRTIGVCTGSTRVDTRTIITQPAHGGSICPELTREEVCTPDIDCEVSERKQGECMENNTMTSTRMILTDPVGNGAKCPELSMVGNCVHTAPEYDLALTKSLKSGQSRIVEIGDMVTFTITVTNQGTVTANSFVIEDNLPSGLTLDDDDWMSIAGNNAEITVDEALDAGDSIDVDITVMVGDINGALINIAQISSDDGDDIDSEPNNNDGDQSEDDEDEAEIVVLQVSNQEICNGRDDDNDGDVDEGFESMSEGRACDDNNSNTINDVYNNMCICAGELRRPKRSGGGGSPSFVNYCGDGIARNGEQCDDGNNVDGDGCSRNCKTTGGVAKPIEPAAVCGNSVKDNGESCDDGNTTNGDGCSDICLIEVVTTPVEIQVVCGDGLLHTTEQCDDGNTINGDGCDASCHDEVEETVIDAIMEKKKAIPTFNPLPLPQVAPPAALPATGGFTFIANIYHSVIELVRELLGVK